MRRLILLSSFLPGIVGGSLAAQSDSRGLDWIDTASSRRMLASAIAAKRFEFLSVCGYACGTPGIGFTQYQHCYNNGAQIRVIDPTGDVIESDRHERLKGRAAALATEYNVLMLRLLDSLGRRTCPAGERWDDLFMDLSHLADGIPRHPFYNSASAFSAGSDADFQFHVSAERDLSPAIIARICTLPPKRGIRRQVRVQITTGNINASPKHYPTIRCLDGRVAT
jgi:hypothetical protein